MYVEDIPITGKSLMFSVGHFTRPVYILTVVCVCVCVLHHRLKDWRDVSPAAPEMSKIAGDGSGREGRRTSEPSLVRRGPARTARAKRAVLRIRTGQKESSAQIGRRKIDEETVWLMTRETTGLLSHIEPREDAHFRFSLDKNIQPNAACSHFSAVVID